MQLRLGGDALGENPLPSASFQTPPIQRVLKHPQVFSGVSHGCRFGVEERGTGRLLLKPTMWFSTSPEICDELSKRCRCEQTPGHHVHGAVSYTHLRAHET